MTIPDAAIEAAAEAAIRLRWPADEPVTPGDREVIRAAIEAAMPAIREAIAQELDEAWLAGTIHSGLDAARIVRGGTDTALDDFRIDNPEAGA